MFLVFDREINGAFYGIYSTREKAETAKEAILKDVFAEMLNEDKSISGIDWENWSKEQKADLVKETADSIEIIEMPLDEMKGCEKYES